MIQWKWTPEREALLREMWVHGKSASDIMRRLNAQGDGYTTRNAVIGKIHRLKLPRRKNNYTPRQSLILSMEMKAKIIRGYTSGMSHAAIARDIKLSPPAATRRIRALIAIGELSPRLTRPRPPKQCSRKRGVKSAPRRPDMKPDDVVPETGADGKPGLTIMELTYETCRYPISHTGHQHRFCGNRAKRGSPYCQGHHVRTHRVVEGILDSPLPPAHHVTQ